MKKITTLLLVSFFYLSGSAQDTSAPVNRSNPGPKEERLTESDKFLSRSGMLVEKQFIDIGKTKIVALQVIKVKDLNSGASISLLSMESKDIMGIREGKAKLDEDEIDGFLKSIILSNRDTYTEIVYQSRGYFEAGAYYEVKKAKWRAFLQLLNYSDKTMMSLTEQDIDDLVILVEKAKIEMQKPM